jgi:hypothetical protein
MTAFQSDSSALPKHLRNFVDRADELDGFRALMDNAIGSPDWRILIFHGPKGIGKSLLLDRIAHECSQRNIPKARLAFEDGVFNNSIRVMRLICDQLGDAAFENWFKLEMEFYTRPLEINIHVDSAPGQGQVNIESKDVTINGNVAGRDMIEIRNNTFATARHDVDPMLIQDSLTNKFIKELEQFVQDKPAVLLFDNVDHKSFDESTRGWLLHDLIERVSTLGGFGVTLVITYGGKPTLGPALQEYTYALKGLSWEHIEEFLRRRVEAYLQRGVVAAAGLAPDQLVSSSLAMSVQEKTKGNPYRVYHYAEKYLKMIDERLST